MFIEIQHLHIRSIFYIKLISTTLIKVIFLLAVPLFAALTFQFFVIDRH
jgi:hypothetical protein